MAVTVLVLVLVLAMVMLMMLMVAVVAQWRLPRRLSMMSMQGVKRSVLPEVLVNTLAGRWQD